MIRKNMGATARRVAIMNRGGATPKSNGRRQTRTERRDAMSQFSDSDGLDIYALYNADSAITGRDDFLNTGTDGLESSIDASFLREYGENIKDEPISPDNEQPPISEVSSQDVAMLQFELGNSQTSLNSFLIGCGIPIIKSEPNNQSHLDEYPVLDDLDTHYNFEVQLVSPNSEKNFVYSKDLKKIFIKERNCLAVKVSFAAHSNDQIILRAMVVYCSPENIPVAVQKCHNHKNSTDTCEDHVKPHILRTSYPNHEYVGREDGILFKDRLSVVIDMGKTDTMINYEFTCQNSCASGMNRRPTSVIFTLEDKSTGAILGRKSMLFKVCSCPKRDKQKEEELIAKATGADNPPKPTKVPGKRKALAIPPPPPGKMEMKRIKLVDIPEKINNDSHDSMEALTPNTSEVTLNFKLPDGETALRVARAALGDLLVQREQKVNGLAPYIKGMENLIDELEQQK